MSSPKKTELIQNPKTTEYEWLGPVGAFFMIATVPMTVVGLNALCTPTQCGLSLQSLVDLVPATQAAFIEHWPNVFLCFQIYTVWILFHSYMYLLPLGLRQRGQPLRTGETLTYNINAIHAMITSYAVIFGGHYLGFVDVGRLADLFYPMAVASLIISMSMAVLLYVLSFRSKSVLLALGGNSGNPIYDFWVGRELNPRIGNLDLKFMFELRPGLIGWTVLCWAFVIKSHQLGQLHPSLPLVALFQTLYVVDGLWYEAGNCTMMDIVHDGFGFMLAVGDLSWVPFLYTLQCRYMCLHPDPQPWWYIAVCVLIQFLGLALFRISNSEKDRFRRNPNDPSVKHLKVMKTSAGKSLIISGCWGICRHPNYVGDWAMTVAWSMLAGCGSLFPYFQPVYFAILLIHRQLRDEHQMKIKYGEKDWKAYCDIVPYRLIPYVY